MGKAGLFSVKGEKYLQSISWGGDTQMLTGVCLGSRIMRDLFRLLASFYILSCLQLTCITLS